MTSSPAISRKVQINSYTYNLTMRRGALADMVQDTLAHFHKALDYAAVGVFDIGENDEGIWYETNDWGATDEARINIWGDIPVTIGGKTVVFSLNQFTETTAAQDLLNLLQEWAFAGANNPYMLDNTQTPPKTQQTASTRVLSPSEMIVLNEKEYILTPKIGNWNELPDYLDESRVAFRVVEIERGIVKLSDGKRIPAYICSMPLPNDRLKFKQTIALYEDNKAFTTNTDLKAKIEAMAMERGDLVEGKWLLLGHVYHDKTGKMKFAWFGLETIA